MGKSINLQNEIGYRIKYIRENNLNLSQKSLAKKCLLDATYISRVEKGKQNLTIETFGQICEGLGMTVREFFDFEIPLKKDSEI